MTFTMPMSGMIDAEHAGHDPREDDPAEPDTGDRAEQAGEQALDDRDRHHRAERKPEREHRRLLAGALVEVDARRVERDESGEEHERGVDHVEDAEQLVELLAHRVDGRDRSLDRRDAGHPEQRALQAGDASPRARA